MHKLETTILPGTRVLIAGDIEAVVERVIFERGRPAPLLLVEWWSHGDMIRREVHSADVTLRNG